MKKLIKDTRGFVFPLFMLIVITVVVVLIIAGFFFSTKTRWILIGIAVLVGAVYIIGKAMTSSNPKIGREKFAIILIFVAVGLFFILGADVLQTDFGGGLTITSMTTPTVISQDTDLKGIWWLINAHSGGGQSLAGTLTPEQSKSLSGYTTQYPLTLTASALSEMQEYQIQNLGDQIYYYDVISTKSPNCPCINYGVTCLIPYVGSDAPACPSGTTYTKSASFPLASKHVCENFCFIKRQIGVLGAISPSQLKSEISLTLSAQGEAITKTIASGSNADFVSATRGLIAQAQIPGSLVTGNSPPSSSNFRAFYSTYQNKNQWTLTSESRWDDYSSKKNVFEAWVQSLNTETYTGGTAEENYNSMVADIANKVSVVDDVALVMEADDLSIDQAQVWGNRNDGQNGKISINLSRQLTVADIVIKIRADWLGIVINAGKPQIVSKTCSAFRAGDAGKISIQVQNIGSADGNFVPSVTCGKIKQTFTMTAVPIATGATKTIDIPVDSGTFAPATDSTDSCQITVSDFNKASNTDSTTVTCTIQTPAQCQEGIIDVAGSCIRKCVGGIPTQLKCCNQGDSILMNVANRNDNLGGYYCFNSTTAPPVIPSVNQTNNQTQLQCKWYQEQSATTNVNYGPLYLGVLFKGLKTVTTTPVCVTASWFTILEIGVLLIVLVAVVLFLTKPKFYKKKR